MSRKYSVALWGLFKTAHRAQYFEEDGRPIHPTCNQGSQCRFVHPEDSNWPGLKPFVDTRLLNKSSSATKRNKETGRASGVNLSNSSESRGPALVSQSDLFLRCKVEVDDQSVRGRPSREWDGKTDRDRDARDRDRHHRDPAGNNDRAHKNYSRNRSISPIRPYAKKYSRTGSDSSRKSEVDSNRSKVRLFFIVSIPVTLYMQQGPTKNGGDSTSNDLKRRSEVSSVVNKPKGSVDSKDGDASSVPTSGWAGHQSIEVVPKIQVAPPLHPSDEKKRTERLVGLFRSLAR